jgi:hypothetical protein
MAASTTTAGDIARRAWARRVLRIGGIIQACFAAFWLVRGSLAIGSALGTELAIFLGAVALAALRYGFRATSGLAPRPSGTDAAPLERAVTIATIVQLAASFLFPAVVIAAGYPDLVLPSIAITIGPLLLWLDRQFDIPRYRPVGWILIVGPILLAVVLSGPALAATTGIAAGVLLLATAATGFHQLAQDHASNLN